MAKRYYQNKKDRKDESRGMKKYEDRMQKDRKDESRGMKDYYMRDYYGGYEGRMRMEREGSMMIKEDHNAIANLPQYESIESYPKSPAYFNANLNDGLRSIDKQQYDDSRKGKKEMYPEKY